MNDHLSTLLLWCVIIGLALLFRLEGWNALPTKECERLAQIEHAERVRLIDVIQHKSPEYRAGEKLKSKQTLIRQLGQCHHKQESTGFLAQRR